MRLVTVSLVVSAASVALSVVALCYVLEAEKALALGRAAEANALACAKASIGTDQAIVDCYHAQGLEPEDL